MKKLFVLIGIIVLLTSTKCYSSESIEKVAENNVEYKQSKVMQDKIGIEFEVWKDAESYGQTTIDEQLAAAKKKLVDDQNLDADAYKQGLIDADQAEIDRLNRIQAVMDKKIIKVIE